MQSTYVVGNFFCSPATYYFYVNYFSKHDVDDKVHTIKYACCMFNCKNKREDVRANSAPSKIPEGAVAL